MSFNGVAMVNRQAQNISPLSRPNVMSRLYMLLQCSIGMWTYRPYII